MTATIPVVRSSLLAAIAGLEQLVEQERERRPRANERLVYALRCSAELTRAAMKHLDGHGLVVAPEGLPPF